MIACRVLRKMDQTRALSMLLSGNLSLTTLLPRLAVSSVLDVAQAMGLCAGERTLRSASLNMCFVPPDLGWPSPYAIPVDRKELDANSLDDPKIPRDIR